MRSLVNLPAARNHLILTFVVLILQFLDDGYAIKCFVCDSTDNASCADLKSNSSLIAEECTLENMKSIGSWLFELNALSFYKTAAYSSPLFNCQKVVAREPERNRVVTARFCQLHTAGSDACKILQNRMLKQEADRQNGGLNRGDFSGSRRNNYGGSGYDTNDDGINNNEQLIHCSICSEDRCNASEQVSATKWSFLCLFALFLVFQQLSSCCIF